MNQVKSAETQDDDLPLLLLDDADTTALPDWKLLIVDDEPAIHTVTRMVLSGLSLSGRALSFLHAHSGAEAREVLARHPDVALILLDVVMETDDAGLKLVRYIRETLGNQRVRIILRTGQPGQAPEQQVVLAYDINDYKEKTELTVQKLTTAVIAALRAYQALVEVATLNAELEAKVTERTRELEQANGRLRRTLSALEQGEQAGRRVQFKLLPANHWVRGDFAFSHLLLPSEYMSGDFLDYFTLDEHQIGFYMADVSGHGVASAFVTVYLKRFVATALECFRHQQPSAIDDPATFLGLLNHELLREKVGKHIAICFGVLDLHRGSIKLANAGAMPYPLHAAAGGATWLDMPSTPVGLFENAPCAVTELRLEPGESLLLCSDGVLEVLPPAPAEARLARFAQTITDLPAALTLDALRQQLDLPDGGPLPDDLALLLLRRAPLAHA